MQLHQDCVSVLAISFFLKLKFQKQTNAKIKIQRKCSSEFCQPSQKLFFCPKNRHVFTRDYNLSQLTRWQRYCDKDCLLSWSKYPCKWADLNVLQSVNRTLVWDKSFSHLVSKLRKSVGFILFIKWTPLLSKIYAA